MVALPVIYRQDFRRRHASNIRVEVLTLSHRSPTIQHMGDGHPMLTRDAVPWLQARLENPNTQIPLIIGLNATPALSSMGDS